jgi:EmrB/QacA subfamily drug resistance transporter
MSPRSGTGAPADAGTSTGAGSGHDGHRGPALALILVAAFMVVLDFSIVNVALPSIQRELGLAASTVQWVVTAYAIAFGGLLILGGRAADTFGRRRMFVSGLVLFSAASLAGGLAHDPVLLLASRALQGAGAAIVAPAALSLITTGFAEGPRRTRALGLYGATASIGFVAGQVLGGVLVDFTSWRSVFLVNVPVGVVAALLTPRFVGESHSPTRTRALDVRGAVLITAAIALLVFAVSEGNTLGWTSPGVIAAAVLSVITVAGFVAAEARHPQPLIPARMLRVRGLRNGASMTLLLGVWNGGEMLVLSVYFQQVLHDSPLVTGLAIAPQGIIGLMVGLSGARLARRIGTHRLLILTAAVAALGFVVLTRLPATGSYSPLLSAVMLVGFGSAGTAFGSMVIASRGVADRDQGLVGGVINTGRQIGAAVGAALLPAVAEAVSHQGGMSDAAGDRSAMVAGMAAGILAVLVALMAERGRRAARQPGRAG